MRFEQFVEKVGHLGIFESSLVLPFYDSPQQAQRQLSDWTRAGKLVQLRRGVYTFAPPYRGERPINYRVANRLVQPSYVSLQSALSYYSMIPEHVAAVTSVTTGRPIDLPTKFSFFIYRHIKEDFLYGYRHYPIFRTQSAYIAFPEKALLDLIYLTPDGDNPAYIHELRLQNLEIINIARLHYFVERSQQPKLKRALPSILEEIKEDTEGWLTS
jgi:predicted transcriptional regulator of viral defense system